MKNKILITILLLLCGFDVWSMDNESISQDSIGIRLLNIRFIYDCFEDQYVDWSFYQKDSLGNHINIMS